MEQQDHRSHGRKSADRILICAAIQMEAEAIAKTLQLQWDGSRTRATGANVVVNVVGVRACRIPRDLQCDIVISAGLAGALDPSLKVGDVIVDCENRFAPQGARLGKIHCAESVVATPSQKAQLLERTGALAVDMESAAIAQFAREQGANFVAIRAISDTAQEAIDPTVLGFVDSFGRAKTGAVISTLIRRPALIPHLVRLRSRSVHACARLADVIAKFVSSIQRNYF
jgi:nucleoside phosphorylase